MANDIGDNILENIIFDSINFIRYTKKKRPTRVAVFKYISESFDVNVDMARFVTVVESLASSGKIKEVRDNENTESLFVDEINLWKNQDNIDNMIDFTDFKKHVLLKLAEFDEQLTKVTIDPPLAQSVNTSPEDRLITSLECQIKSLEKQLNDKQIIIEALLSHRPSLDHNYGVSPTKHIKTVSPVITNHKGFSSDKQTYNNKVINRSNNNLINECNSDNNNKQTKNNVKHKQHFNKPKAIVIGDSIVSGLDQSTFSGSPYNVKIHPESGSTSWDMLHYMTPRICKKPSVAILHVGTNDITNGVNTVDNLKSIVNLIKEESPDTKLILSSVTFRADQKGIKQKVEALNKSIKDFCTSNSVGFVNNSNIGAEHLPKKKLHLNRKGSSTLVKKLLNSLNNI